MRTRYACVLSCCVVMLAACKQAPGPPASGPQHSAVLLDNARVITGDGSAAIEGAAVLIVDNRIAQVGRRGQVTAPDGARRVDVTGKTIMPALIDAHSHLGYTDVKRMTTSASNYTRATLVDHLR